MSDDIENNSPPVEPPKRGRGRPPKSKQKTPTSKEVEDALLELHMPAVKVLAKLLKSDSEQVKLKAAVKVDELARDINERRKEAGEGELEQHGEQKANGTTGTSAASNSTKPSAPKKLNNKVSYLKPTSDKEEDEQED